MQQHLSARKFGDHVINFSNCEGKLIPLLSCLILLTFFDYNIQEPTNKKKSGANGGGTVGYSKKGCAKIDF